MMKYCIIVNRHYCLFSSLYTQLHTQHFSPCCFQFLDCYVFTSFFSQRMIVEKHKSNCQFLCKGNLRLFAHKSLNNGNFYQLFKQVPTWNLLMTQLYMLVIATCFSLLSVTPFCSLQLQDAQTYCFQGVSKANIVIAKTDLQTLKLLSFNIQKNVLFIVYKNQAKHSNVICK